jgi:hypothetical protein
LAVGRAGQSRYREERRQSRAGTRMNPKDFHQAPPDLLADRTCCATSKRNGRACLTGKASIPCGGKKAHIGAVDGSLDAAGGEAGCKKWYLNAPFEGSNYLERKFEEAGTGAGIPLK